MRNALRDSWIARGEVLEQAPFGEADTQNIAHSVFRNGKVEFAELPEGIPDEARAVVTFVSPESSQLEKLGITRAQAAAFRWGLGAAIEDWESPEMDDYDDYDRHKAELDKRYEALRDGGN